MRTGSHLFLRAALQKMQKAFRTTKFAKVIFHPFLDCILNSDDESRRFISLGADISTLLAVEFAITQSRMT